MFDPDQVPLSTSEGRRPSSTAGDRMMVGLAALALIGGLLIAASRLIPEQPDQTSQATATPRSSASGSISSPRPSPAARPARSIQVDPSAIPGPAPPGQLVSEWVRLKTRVTLLNEPSSDARPSGVLRRGVAAYLYEVPPDEGGTEGWLRVDSPTFGWILGEIDNEAMFERFPYRWRPTGYIVHPAANPTGFTALAWATDVPGEVMLASSDGLQWETVDAPDAWGRTVANGPAGWLMAGNVDQGNAGSIAMVWQSADARTWEPLGALLPTVAGNIQSIVGSEAGYVMTTGTGPGVSGVWFSADGQLWTERPMEFARSDRGMRVAATALGFFVWMETTPLTEADGAFSVDGWTWSEADVIGPGQVIDVVADGDHLLALGRAEGGTRIWKGMIQGPQLTWSNENIAPFRDAAVSRMVSDGERVVVLGWDRDTEAPLWWHQDGLSWQRHAMPAEFEGLPHVAAGGPRGIVAVDQVTSGGDTPPVFWHLGDGVRWERERSPVMPVPSPPTPEACGPTPDDLLALITTDGLLAAECFGDAPITVRGWSTACDGCYFQSEGRWETEWLASPTEEVVHLAPIESGDWGSLDGVLHPSYRGRPPRPSRWLEVTGHFDDPAAVLCRWTPTVLDEEWYTGTHDIVAGCRARFVVTAIRPVKGP